jgi:ribokinase
MKGRIMVYGSYAVGMTMHCKDFPAAGQTVPGKNFQQFHGGKGSNQAIAAARLGGNVCYVSCVGRDKLGEAALALFKNEGLDARVKISEKNATSVGFVMVEESGQNRIIINFDAPMEIGPADIDALEDEWKDCKILLMQLEADIPTIVYAARKAKEHGVCVIMNPAPFQELPKEIFPYLDVITPNETEAKQMLGIDPAADIPPEELGGKLLSTGIKEVIITVGENGAVLANAGGIIHIPVGRTVSALDTTGAGDTFAGGLAVALGEGLPIEKAVVFANTAASISVTRHGVVESIPSREEVIRIINKRGG